MFCPNYKNKTVFDGFNEIVEALGGKPLTEEEFKSKELRFQRTGLDYSAMEAAYSIYHLNNGNLINFAPNGKPSKLFDTLLDYFQGDNKKAIVAKAKVYSNKFLDWFGDWLFQSQDIDQQTKDQVSLIFKRIPQLSKIGTEEQYAQYIQTIFPNSQDKSIYWHGSDSDFSRGFKSAKRGEGSGAPETKERNDFYLAKQAWSVLQYVSGVNRKSVDKNGFSIWNKLWFEFKEIMANGRRENNDWKNIVINENTVRQAIPDKKGIFDRNQGKGHGKWLKERKADYGYENKSDKEFFEEILGVRWGVDTFNTWTQRNAEIFKSLQETERGIYPAVINTVNPIRENGQDTYYEEHRGLFTKADAEGNDAVLGSETDNEFGSDVAVVLRDNSNVHFLGTQEDMDAFSKFVNRQNVSKVVDENGEPFVVYHNTRAQFDEFDKKYIRTADGFFFTVDNTPIKAFGDRQIPVYLNVKNLKETDSTMPTGDDFDYQNDGFDGMQYFFMDSESFIIPNPNQIKHIQNLGAWDTSNPNMKDNNKQRFNYPIMLDKASGNSIFGSSYTMLENGNNVSSNVIITHLISSNLLSEDNVKLAKIIARHNIPIMFGELENDKIAGTITDQNGGSIVVINSKEISNVTNEFLANRILHETVHALTTKALTNPQTKEERNLSRSSKTLYSMLDKIAPKNERADIHSGGYVMENEREFAAVFATDENARNYVYKLARKYDYVARKVKQFIDSIVNFFAGKPTSNTQSAIDAVEQYKQDLYDYLYNRPTAQYGDIKSSELIDVLFETASGKSFAGDSIQNAIRNAEHEDSDLQINYATIDKKYDFETIARTLMTRLQLIKRSNIGKDEISRQSQLIESQASMLISEDPEVQYTALQSLASQIGPQLHEDYQRIKQLPNLNADEYMDYMHTNVGTYKKLADACGTILKDSQQVGKILQGMYKGKDRSTEEGAEEFEKFKNNFVRDVQRMIDTFEKIENLSNSCIKILDKIRTKSTKNLLLDIGRTVGDPDIDNYLTKLERIDFDISSAVRTLGAADAAKDAALRALAYLVNSADTKTYTELNSIAKRLANAFEGLTKKELRSFYELDLDGNTTGYLVRKRNYGVFYNAYNNKIIEINRHISSKYGISLDDNNRIAPDGKEARKEWNSLRNDWLEQNCDRRYVNRYYRAQEELSSEALLRMQTINSQIYQINMTPGVIQEATGKPDYFYLDDDKWEELQNLITKKKFLRKEVDEWGNQKCDAELEIAKEIDAYYKKLYPDSGSHIQQDVKAWKDARHKMFEGCGGDPNTNPDFYEDFIKNTENPFDVKKWRKWNQRNSKLEFIQDDDGKPLVFKKIQSEFGQVKPYYGEEEAAIAKQVNDMINTFYGTNMIVNDRAMTKSMQNKIKNLIKKQIKLRKKAIENNPVLEQLSKKYGAIFNSYIEFVTTERFNQLSADAMDRASETGVFDELYYYELLSNYGTIIEDWTTAEIIGFRPFRWFTTMRAKDVNKWMRWVPGDAYNDIENSKSLKNEFFDELEGVSFVPLIEDHQTKKAINPEYNNTKLFERLTKPGSKTEEMYNTIVDIMKTANSKMENRNYADNYLLPQVGGTLYTRLTSKNAEDKHGYIRRKWKLITDWIGEKFGIKERKQQDDFEQMFGETMSLDDTDETGEIVGSKRRNIKDLGLLKNMPDERSMHMVPQFFTARKNPKYISKDLLGIVFMYYQMAANYKNKIEIKNQCEMIIDAIASRTYEKRSDESNQIEEIGGQNTNTYQFAKKFLEMNLYDIRREKHTVRLSKNSIWQYTNALEMLKNYTTANNLGLNPKVSIVGVLTSQYNHLINAISGNGYSFGDANFGGAEVIHRMVRSSITKDSYIGNMNSKDKLMVIDEFYNVQNQLDKKVKGSNLNRGVRTASENGVFGFMSGLDFMSKSAIAVSILHSFRFVDGEWVTEDILYRNSVYIPKPERKKWLNDKLKKYKKAKKEDNLYSSISVGQNGEFVILDDKKRKAYTEDIHHIVKSRIEKTAERADGMATKTQKAAWTQSEIGALALVHRQYLPLMIQERFGEEVYDYDMAMFKNGQTRLLYNLCRDVARSSVMGGAGVGALASYTLLRSASNLAFGSSIPVLALGALAGYIYSSKNKDGRSSVKNVINKYFKNESTQNDAVKSLYHQRVLRQIVSELAIYNLMIAPIINYIASKADDDKHKTWWLQFAALCLRQFQWEAYTPYRFDDVFNNFKSVTAATGTIDYLQSSLGGAVTIVTQMLYSLLDTLANKETENNSKNKVKSGVYKDWNKVDKNFYKTIPIHNMYQQGFYAPTIKDGLFSPTIEAGGAIGPYKMRQYMENSIMKINED